MSANGSLALDVDALNAFYGKSQVVFDLGLTVGRDFSIVGYNDIPLASRLPVPLTSVRTPFDQIAAEAMDLLLEGDAQPGVVRHTLPTLMPRASTVRLN